MHSVTPAQSLRDRLSAMSSSRFKTTVYLTATLIFLLSVWLHIPNGGGHIHTDIIHVFRSELCKAPPPNEGSYAAYIGEQSATTCESITIPYIQSLTEYPVLVAMFLYGNVLLGNSLPGDLLTNFYYFSSLFLFFPTLLAAREMLKLIDMRGVERNRIFWYFIITPTFIYMNLLNWYIIGVWLSLFGIRKYLEGSRVFSGILFGLSAASNFVTAAPALGLLIASRKLKEGFLFAVSALGTYGALNAPFVILNEKQWLASFQYIYNWNIEDSWMQAFLPSLYDPARHYIPPVVFSAMLVIMLWLRFKGKMDDPLVFGFISMFGYVFSTYIYTPQINLMLLPFFVLLPVSGTYLEFLAFDITNALIIIWGFSQALQPLGITYPAPTPITRSNPVFWVEVIRSVWQGKFTFFNGAWSVLSLDRVREGEVTPQPTQNRIHPT